MTQTIRGIEETLGTVQVVDPDPLFAERLAGAMGADVRVISSRDGRHAVAQLLKSSVDAAVVSMEIDDIAPEGVIGILHEYDPRMPVFAISSKQSEEVEDSARQCGIVLYAVKPLDEWMLAAAVRTALEGSDRPRYKSAGAV